MDGQTGRQPDPTPEELQAKVDAYRIGPTPPTEAQIRHELVEFLKWLYQRKDVRLCDEVDLIDLGSAGTFVFEYLNDPYFTQRGDRR